MTELMEDIEGAEVIVDDILIWGAIIEEHDDLENFKFEGFCFWAIPDIMIELIAYWCVR